MKRQQFTSRAGERTRTRRRLRVLIACEESQRTCISFRELGHYAFSADIQPAGGGHPEWHILGDVTPLLDGKTDFVTQDGVGHLVPGWDLIISHPPCTYLTKLSLTSLRVTGMSVEEHNRRTQLGAAFFMRCYNAPAPYIAVENPQPLKRANLPPPSCYVQPSWFGEKYTKKTLFWLKNLPPLLPEIEFPNPKSYVHCSRGKYRSRTFWGIARAMASQWSEYILDDLKQQQKTKRS